MSSADSGQLFFEHSTGDFRVVCNGLQQRKKLFADGADNFIRQTFRIVEEAEENGLLRHHRDAERIRNFFKAVDLQQLHRSVAKLGFVGIVFKDQKVIKQLSSNLRQRQMTVLHVPKALRFNGCRQFAERT